MCNLYSMTRPQDAVRRFFPHELPLDRVGNLPPLPGIFPDYSAPIVRNCGDGIDRPFSSVKRSGTEPWIWQASIGR
jgi:hypothetical protein